VTHKSLTMVSWLGELHIWTLNNHTIIPDEDVGCFTYREKNYPVEQNYAVEKCKYTESRDATWTPRNKRPERLRDTLKEVEDLLSHHKCIHTVWINKRLLQIYISNGCIVSFAVSQHTGDVDKIVIDKTLLGKLSGDSSSAVLPTNNFLVVAHADKTKLDYIYFTKKINSSEIPKKLEKLSVYEPKVCQVDLPGPVGRRLDRHLVCNIHQDLVLCWWPTASEEAWPWAPITGDRDRANVVILAAHGGHLGLVAYTRTEGNPMDIQFSVEHGHRILTVECSTSNEINADICMYELQKGKIQRLSVVSIPLKSEIVCQGRACTEDRVLLGCQDSSLVLFDENRKVTQLTKAALSPAIIEWHPSGVIVAVASRKGQVQLFDQALTPLTQQLIKDDLYPLPTLDINNLFRSPTTLEHIAWSPMLEQPENVTEPIDSLFIICDRGPLAMLQYSLGVLSQGQLTPLALLNQYIKHKQTDEAVNILCSLSWNVEGATCYACLSAIINYLLRQSLNASLEVQLEAALGTFYAPPKPLNEATVLEFRDPVGRLARRFFHHLLRYTRFDKAYLLAVDIGSRDLFMDIHYVATDKGETALAEVARRKADQIETMSSDTSSFEEYEDAGSEEDSSENSESYDSDSDYIDNIAPPRPPRVPCSNRDVKRAPPLPPVLTNPPPITRFNANSHELAMRPDHAWKQSSMYMPEAALQQLEEELSSEMFHEYTVALLDDIPPPHVPPDEQLRTTQQQSARVEAEVKVIHFGIV